MSMNRSYALVGLCCIKWEHIASTYSYDIITSQLIAYTRKSGAASSEKVPSNMRNIQVQIKLCMRKVFAVTNDISGQ